MMINAWQVDYNRSTIWVFLNGDTVGRFSTKFGMDVHRTTKEQMAGKGECLRCTHTKPTYNDWDEFRFWMKHHYRIDIPENEIDITQLARLPSYLSNAGK
jgi:hypothetical protein